MVVNILHLISILLEIIVIILGLKIALKNRIYGWLIALTFSIYVFYDISRFTGADIPANILDISFLIASVSILWVVWKIYKN